MLANDQYHINVLVLWVVAVTQMMIVIAVAHDGLEEAVMGALSPHNVETNDCLPKIQVPINNYSIVSFGKENSVQISLHMFCQWSEP